PLGRLFPWRPKPGHRRRAWQGTIALVSDTRPAGVRSRTRPTRRSAMARAGGPYRAGTAVAHWAGMTPITTLPVLLILSAPAAGPDDVQVARRSAAVDE